LKATLDASPASQAIVEEVYKRFVGLGGSEQSDLTAFLIAAADQQALPGAVMNTLLEKATDAVARDDGAFMDTEYARILAHGMRQVTEPSRPLVYRLIDMVAARVTPLASSTAEMYTALGRQGLATPAMVQKIVAHAAVAPPYRPEEPGVVSEPLPGMAIVVGYGPWLKALAVLGTAQPLPQAAIEILEEHANDPTLRDTILRALVRHPPWNKESCWTASCGRTLRAFPDDAAKRQLVSDLLAERLAGLPRGECLAAIEALHKERESETEPEIRIALGLAAINAQLARVRVTPLGDQLFE